MSKHFWRNFFFQACNRIIVITIWQSVCNIEKFWHSSESSGIASSKPNASFLFKIFEGQGKKGPFSASERRYDRASLQKAALTRLISLAYSSGTHFQVGFSEKNYNSFCMINYFIGPLWVFVQHFSLHATPRLLLSTLKEKANQNSFGQFFVLGGGRTVLLDINRWQLERFVVTIKPFL